MAFMRMRTTGIGGLGASLLLVACTTGGTRSTGGPETTGEDTTGSITTFEPTTSIDPSDPTLTGSESGPGTTDTTEGSSTAGPADGSSSGDGTTEGSSSGGDEAPTVQSTTPGDLASGIAADTTIEVEFSEAMDPATITTTTAGSACTGTIQLSADGFATCVTMAAAPSSADDVTFSVTPAAALDSATTYQIRVLTDATDAGGTPLAAEHVTATGFIVRYFHTVVIDGVDEFDPDEQFPTSTGGHTARVAWDDQYVYLGLDSPDVATGNNQVWWVAYVGGPAGTNQGVTYNTQSPALPFSARWHVRWRTDGGFYGALEWTGAAWQPAAFTIEPADVDSSGTFVELRVARADLGDPAYLDLHLGLLREQAFNEWSWAAVPQGSYGEGYDPDYGQYFQFDLAGSTLPADVPPS